MKHNETNMGGNVHLLDCTLRDGGYVNNWQFGRNHIQAILRHLVEAGIDCIEAGFLKEVENSPGSTVFGSVEALESVLPERPQGCASRFFGMIVYGQYPQDKIPPHASGGLDGIRVTFKKPETDAALAFCRELMAKGYLVSANPTGVSGYTDAEYLGLIGKINELSPFAFAIVDTLGTMRQKDAERVGLLVDHNLSPGIALCFHSHNNLQLSFANAMELMAQVTRRPLIIDCCVFGMGRGAGNLCTELMVRHINDLAPGSYDLIPLLRIADEHLGSIFARTPWGYSVPYYLAAANGCHPNYAGYLIEKRTLTIPFIDTLLKSIPEEKRTTFNRPVIEELYLRYQSRQVDDTAAVHRLQPALRGRNVLILAPGRTLLTHRESLEQCMWQENPVTIALNALPPSGEADFLFVPNRLRYQKLDPHGAQAKLIVTSNIDGEVPADALVLNYADYLNDSLLFDNAALMLLSLLLKVGVGRVFLAGMDGFGNTPTNDYAQPEMSASRTAEETDDFNGIMSAQLRKMKAAGLNLSFITPSLYE